MLNKRILKGEEKVEAIIIVYKILFFFLYPIILFIEYQFI